MPPTPTATTASAASAQGAGIRSGWLRAAVVLAGSVAAACVVLPALPYLESQRGVAAALVADALRPGPAALALLLALACCTAIGCAVGRAVNAAVGLFVLGCGVAMLSMRTGCVMDAAFSEATLRGVAVETLVWGGAVLAMSAAVFRASGALPDIPARDPKGPFVREIFNADSVRSALVGLVALAAAWLLVRTDMKGQALGAGVLGGVAVAIAGRRFLGTAQPILLVAAPVALIAAAQLATSFMLGGALDHLVVAHALPGWSRMMPMDVAAGALVGVPVGLGWSRASTDE